MFNIPSNLSPPLLSFISPHSLFSLVITTLLSVSMSYFLNFLTIFIRHSPTPLPSDNCQSVLCIYESVSILFVYLFFKYFIYLLLQRGEGREQERERNIDMQEKHQLAASRMPTTGDLAHNPAMCPDWELNQDSTHQATLAKAVCLFCSIDSTYKLNHMVVVFL